MSDYKTITLTRDCDAILVPHGQPMRLEKGTLVVMVQALGDAFTLQMNGHLVEVDGQDADALEQPVPVNPLANLSEDASLEDKVWAVLRGCYDPEIPLNIVDLGLIYQCEIMTLDQSEWSHKVFVQMTLTSPTCGMGPLLVQKIERNLKNLNGIDEVVIELVFSPPWSRDRLSLEAQLQLGLF